jgi:hypothetical protein
MVPESEEPQQATPVVSGDRQLLLDLAIVALILERRWSSQNKR